MAVSRLGSSACFSRIVRISGTSVDGKPAAASFSFQGASTGGDSVSPVPASVMTVPTGWVDGCDAGCEEATVVGPVVGPVVACALRCVAGGASVAGGGGGGATVAVTALVSATGL